MRWFLKLAVRRLQARWQSLLTLIIGVLLAAAIGATAPLYTTAISQVGMAQYLASQPQSDIHVYNRVSLAPAETDNFTESWRTFDSLFDDTFNTVFPQSPAWVEDVITWAESQPLFVLRDGEDIPDTQVRVAYYENLSEHADLISGAWPSETSGSDAADTPLEVVLPAAIARRADISSGDTLQLDQRGWDTSQVFTMQVTGIIRESNPDAAYWFKPSSLRLDASGSDIEPNIFTTRASMERIPPAYLPQPRVQIGWRVVFDHKALPFSEIDSAVSDLEALETDLRRAFLQRDDIQGTFVYNTGLPGLLNQYAQEIVFLNVPFGLLLVQLGALVLFFLVLIAALVRRGERREIALLQSRGAFDRQLLLVRDIEAFIICTLAALIAPFLAQQLLLLYVPALTGIDTIPLNLQPIVFGFSGGAAFVAFILLLVTLLPVLRQPLILAGGSASRSDSQTWWQKYYLDVVLLIVGMAALVQLTGSQSLLAESGETTQVDPLLLLAPTLLFVAFSSVLLRFFPGVMRLLARFTSRSQRSLELPLASWQVSREPLHYGRIAFLLALAIGIGWFAIGYQATLTGNQRDQAAYTVGSDVRLIYSDPQNPAVSDSMARIASLPDVTAVSRVTRIEAGNMSTGGGRRSRESGTILAINGDTFREVAYWRDDLGTLHVPEYEMPASTDIGFDIPDNTGRIRFRAQLSAQLQIGFGQYVDTYYPYPTLLLRVTDDEQPRSVLARIRTGDGDTRLIPAAPDTEAIDAFFENRESTDPIFQAVDTDGNNTVDTIPPVDWPDDGWLTFEVNVSDLNEMSQFVALRVSIPRAERFALVMADAVAIDTDGNERPLDWFNTDDTGIVGSQGELYPESVLTQDDIPDNIREILPESYNRYPDSSIYFLWGMRDNDQSKFNLLLNYPELATVQLSRGRDNENPDTDDIQGMPVIASQRFTELNEFSEGQLFSLFVQNVAPWFQIDDSTRFYPTLTPDEPFLIVDQELLNYTLQRTGINPPPPGELWLKLAPGTDSNDFLAALRQSDDAALFDEIRSVQATLNTYETDVLSLGVIGLLFLSFVVGLVLSMVSLFTYISLSVQARLSEFAVLRAMGLSGTRLTFSILVEQGLVLLSAIVLGGIIGQFLTLQVLPPLALSAAGGDVTPPFALRMDWFAIIRYLLLITGVLFGVLLLSAVRIRQTASVNALRLTEE